MADTRISSAPRVAPNAPKNAAKKADDAPAAKLAGDSLKTKGPDPVAAAMDVLDSALNMPKKPGKADQKAWLLDAYSRLLKAEAAMDALDKAWGSGVEIKGYSELRLKLWDAERKIEQADKTGEVKKEFFAGVLPEAQSLLDGLAKYPAPPADKAGKEAWLADAKGKLAQAKAASEVFKEAWMTFHAASFDQQADVGRKLFDFEGRIRQVEYELHPPAPRPATPGQSGSHANAPLFGLTQGAGELANSKNPVGQVTGAVLLPIALTVDMIDLVTRPFQWLNSVSGKK